MAQRQGQVNFSKGEVSQEMYARFDVQAYSSAAKRALNVRVRKYGGLAKRLGTRFVCEVYDATKPVRLIPFQFSIEQAYALEMGQGYMRPAALGGMVLEEQLTITGITNAANARVSMAYHGYSVGDDVFYTNVAGMTEINGKTARVASVVDDHNYTIDLDTTGFGIFAGDVGGITRSAPAPAPPPPPVVPPVVPPPDPPTTGGGNGGAGGGPSGVPPYNGRQPE